MDGFLNMFLSQQGVTIDDFIKATSKIKATVSQKDLEKQNDFTEEFGQEG